MSDVTKCEVTNCKELVNLVKSGHTLCRAHALCSKGLNHFVWEPYDCPICTAWMASIAGDSTEPSRDLAISQMSYWVNGFAKASQNRAYLASEELRQRFFPLAPLRAVFGYKPEPTPRGLGDSADAMAVDSPGDRTLDSSVNVEVTEEEEEGEILSHEELVQGLSGHRKTPVEDEPVTMTGIRRMVEEAVARRMTPFIPDQNSGILGNQGNHGPLDPSSWASTSSGDPLRFCPWTPCSFSFCLPDVNEFWNTGIVYPLNRIEFPNGTFNPNGFWRMSNRIVTDRVPREAIILSKEVANGYVTEIFRSLPSMENVSYSLFDGEVPCIPWDTREGSFTKKVLEALWDDLPRLMKPGGDRPSLQECVLFISTTPRSYEELPHASKYADLEALFRAPKLKADIPRKQLGPGFPPINLPLINSEWKKRCSLSASWTVLCGLERGLAQAPPPYANFGQGLAKLQNSCFLDALCTYASTKAVIRESCFAGTNKDLEGVQRLLNSNPFCPLVFPEDEVKQVRDGAAQQNICLAVKWRDPPKLPAGSRFNVANPSTSGLQNPSTSGHQKKRRNRRHRPQKAGRKQQFFQHQDKKGKSATGFSSFRGGRGGHRGGKHTPSSAGPSSQQ